MPLDVEAPDPPDLTNRSLPSDIDPDEAFDGVDDLRREELEEILQDGAWSEAFNEWAAYTDISEEEYRNVRDAGLLEGIDFYWDPIDERLRFEVPALPEGTADRPERANRVASELMDLGETVIEMLEDGYVEWGREDEPEDVWSEEHFGEDTAPED